MIFPFSCRTLLVVDQMISFSCSFIMALVQASVRGVMNKIPPSSLLTLVHLRSAYPAISRSLLQLGSVQLYVNKDMIFNKQVRFRNRYSRFGHRTKFPSKWSWFYYLVFLSGGIFTVFMTDTLVIRKLIA